MQLDFCIPVYRNLNCLRVAALGIKRHSKAIGKVFLHVQLREEASEALKIVSEQGLPAEVVSIGDNPEPMATYMDRLFSCCKSPWVVMMEQDTFLLADIDELANRLNEQGFVAAGPLDTMLYDSPTARHMPLYGRYARLSPEPGYYHSSLILLNREYVASKSSTPFTIPAGFKMHGTGVLGGESYYGLRVHLDDDRKKLAFFRQDHAAYGYAAAITFAGQLLAMHLYYSGTRDGYLKSGFLNPEEHGWLASSESKFLWDYEGKML